MMMTGASWQTALEALRPLEARLEAALSAGDVESAMRMAFRGAQEAVALVADAGPEVHAPRLHRVYVELTPLPLDAFEDGTLSENGAYVRLEYQGWAVHESDHECPNGHCETLAS
jgi:hypothetical protein